MYVGMTTLCCFMVLVCLSSHCASFMRDLGNEPAHGRNLPFGKFKATLATDKNFLVVRQKNSIDCRRKRGQGIRGGRMNSRDGSPKRCHVVQREVCERYWIRSAMGVNNIDRVSGYDHDPQATYVCE